MDHAITVAGLLLSIGVLVGLVLAALGFLAVMAGGMSDSPSAGESAASTGCGLLLAGVAILVGSLIGLFS